MTIDISQVSNCNTVWGCMKVANTYTEGVFGLFLLVVIGVALLYKLKSEPTREIMAATLFAESIIGILLAILGVANSWMVGAVITLFIGAEVFLINNH